MILDRIWYLFDIPTMVGIVILLCCVLLYKKYRDLPPGPWGLPFFGFLYFMLHENVHYKYYELSGMYGKIFHLKLGQKNLVILADPKMIKEAFTKEAFSGKPYNEFYKLLGGYGKCLEIILSVIRV